VGFVVSKAVGDAVTRNRVKRRLRHAVRPRLAGLDRLMLVIRANPAAASADFSEMSADLERCLAKVESSRR
jgi:ribonuclease P protein component